jgi:hypothetical protein
VTPDNLLAEMEQDIEWRSAEINWLLRDINDDPNVPSRARRRSIVPVVNAHAEGFVRFALIAYIRFLNLQSVPGNQVKDVHVAWGLTKEFNRVRQTTVDDGYRTLGLDEEDRAAKKHYGETVLLRNLATLLEHPLTLDDSQLSQFDQNLDARYLRSLLFRCGLDVNPHTYAGRLNGLVIRRNEIAHGENSVASVSEIRTWHQTVSTLFVIMRDEVYNAARNRSYLRAA